MTDDVYRRRNVFGSSQPLGCSFLERVHVGSPFVVALGVALSAAATVALVGGIDRFEPIGQERLVNAGAIDGWRTRLAGTGSVQEEDGAIVLRTGPCPDAEGRCGALADQNVALAGARLMVLSAEVTRSGVTGEPWPSPIATVSHAFIDVEGRPLWKYASALEVGVRDSPWHRIEHGFLVDPAAGSIEAQLELAARSGELRVRDVSLRPARLRTLWLGVAGLIAVAWLAGALHAAWRLIGTADRKVAAWLTIVVVLSLVPPLLMPQAGLIFVGRDVTEQLHDAPSTMVPKPQPLDRPSLPRRAVAVALRGVGEDTAHFAGFLVLGWAATWTRRRPNTGIALGLFSSALAAEALQVFSLDRSIELRDVGLDTLGASIGLLTAAVGGAWRPRPSG